MTLFLPMTPDVTPDTETTPADLHTPSPASSQKASPQAKEGFRFVRGLALVAGIVACAAILTASVYLRSPEDAFVQKVSSVVPYPAAFVGWDPISLHDYFAERTAVEKYLTSTNPEGAIPEDLGVQILETLINKQAIEHLARAQGLKVSQEDIDARYQDAVGEMEESLFVTQLNETLGWTPKEFKQRILRSLVLAEVVGAWVSSDQATQKEPRSRIDAAHTRLTSGEDFALVASEASEDLTAANGGDLGFLSVTDLPEDWRDQVMTLEVGAFTPVVETDVAFVIFTATDRVVGEAEDAQIRLSAIVIQKQTLEDVVGEYLESVNVRKLVRL